MHSGPLKIRACRPAFSDFTGRRPESIPTGDIQPSPRQSHGAAWWREPVSYIASFWDATASCARAPRPPPPSRTRVCSTCTLSPGRTRLSRIIYCVRGRGTGGGTCAHARLPFGHVRHGAGYVGGGPRTRRRVGCSLWMAAGSAARLSRRL